MKCWNRKERQTEEWLQNKKVHNPYLYIYRRKKNQQHSTYRHPYDTDTYIDTNIFIYVCIYMFIRWSISTLRFTFFVIVVFLSV